MSGVILALFWVLIACIGASCAYAFLMGLRS